MTRAQCGLASRVWPKGFVPWRRLPTCLAVVFRSAVACYKVKWELGQHPAFLFPSLFCAVMCYVVLPGT